MHLHGFYFRVTGTGTPAFETALAPADQRLVVSEPLTALFTYTMEWVPERAGNWLYHCHWIAHMSPAQQIARLFNPDTPGPAHTGHAHEMAGMVLGISVKDKTPVALKAATPARQLRLFANERPRVFGEKRGLGFVLQEGSAAPARDSVRIPGSPIVLTRGEPTQITLFNRLQIPLAVHWHGLEVESYFDGVPGFSGAAHRLAPSMAPGDSFVVQINAPRAGTFIYHVHSEAADELNSGLYGPLIVREPRQHFDPAADHTVVVASGGRGIILVNGSKQPAGITMSAGLTQRIRLIAIPANGSYIARLKGPTATPLQWRQIARDGANLPTNQIVEGPAEARIMVGVTMDFEFTPKVAGEYTLEVDYPPSARPPATTSLPITVQATPSAPLPLLDARQENQRRTLERALLLLNDQVRWSRYATASDVLWSLFCAVQAESSELAPRRAEQNVCANLQPPPAGTASPAVVAEARNLIRMALDRRAP
jgi:FtsP/CotA-like multicopper oxidase with cupredoxin domain